MVSFADAAITLNVDIHVIYEKLLHPTKDAAVRLYIGFYIQVDSTAR